MARTIFILNGPNLNLLGLREPDRASQHYLRRQHPRFDWHRDQRSDRSCTLSGCGRRGHHATTQYPSTQCRHQRHADHGTKQPKTPRRTQRSVLGRHGEQAGRTYRYSHRNTHAPARRKVPNRWKPDYSGRYVTDRGIDRQQLVRQRSAADLARPVRAIIKSRQRHLHISEISLDDIEHCFVEHCYIESCAISSRGHDRLHRLKP